MKFFGKLIFIPLFILTAWFYYAFFLSNAKGDININNPPTIINIGWIGPLSGSASMLGIDNLKSVKLAFSEYTKNKPYPKINLIVSDDQYDTNRCKAAYKQMTKSVKLLAVFISTYSCVKALSKSAEKDSIIIIEPIDNDTNLANLNTQWNANLFLIAKETEALAAIDANAIIAQNKKNTLVIYYGDDDFMPTLALTLTKILQKNDIAVKLFKYSGSKTNFNEFLQWGISHHVDSYVFFGYAELGFAMREARELGITAPFYSVNLITDLQYQKNANNTTNGTYFANFTFLDGNQLKVLQFKKNFFNAYHTYPFLEWPAMQAYDATNILFDAIDSAKNNKGNFNETIRNLLRNVTDYQGVSGSIAIKPNGASQGIYPSLYILKAGNPEKLDFSDSR